MTTEKEQLEAEIAKRDTQIAELERFKCAYNEWHEKTEWVQSEVSTGIIGASALGLHRADVMTRLVAELRLELAALKADLSACVIGGTGISSSMRGALAEAGQQPASGGAYSSDPLACSGCAAGCFRCRSSAGVVVGALVSALEGIVHDERVPNEVSQDYAALLIEARRLNHCRAQAVPDGMKGIGVIDESDDGVFVYLHDDQSFKLGQKVYAGAPSTEKESGYYSDQDWINAGCPRNEESDDE